MVVMFAQFWDYTKSYFVHVMGWILLPMKYLIKLQIEKRRHFETGLVTLQLHYKIKLYTVFQSCWSCFSKAGELSLADAGLVVKQV